MRRTVLLSACILVAGLLVFVAWRGEPEHVGSVTPESLPNAASQRRDSDLTPVPEANADRESSAIAPTSVSAPAPVRDEIVLRGRVVLASGRTLAEADVALQETTTRSLNRSRKTDGSVDAPIVRTRTAADGTFRVTIPRAAERSLENGIVTASARGFARAERMFGFEERKLVELGDIVLIPGTTLSGIVRDVDGNRIADAEVYATATRPEFAGREVLHSTRSGAGGAFLFEDGPSGLVRLSARLEDRRGSERIEVAVEPGDVRADFEIVVANYAADNAISGVVVTPAGEPTAGATLQYFSSSPDGSTGSELGRPADAQGRFRFSDQPGSAARVSASDPKGEFGPAIPLDVPLGTHGIVLRLTEKRTVLLHVESEIGAAVPKFSYEVIQHGTDSDLGVKSEDVVASANGDALVDVPSSSFSLRIVAPGFERATIGPFDPFALTPQLVAKLRALPAIRGRVVRGSEPAGGVLVRAQRALDRGESTQDDGFSNIARGYHSDSPTATTAQDGTFELEVSDAGAWYVGAGSGEAASALVGPLVCVSGGKPPEVEIDLAQRGSIAGRVHTAAGKPIADRAIEASCGDGEIRTVTTDARGDFVFADVAAALWQVRMFEPDTRGRRGSRTSSALGDAPPIPWDCEVLAGKTTRFDILVPDPVRFELRITEADPRLPAGSWVVKAIPTDPKAPVRRVRELQAAELGLHVLDLPSGGTWRVFAEFAGGGTSVRLSRTVDVSVSNPLEWVLPRGDVRGKLRAGTAAGMRVVLMGNAPDGAQVFAKVTASDNGTFVFPFAFAGESILTVDQHIEGDERSTVANVVAGVTTDVGEL